MGPKFRIKLKCEITDKGAEIIAKNDSLVRLNLSRNRIQDEGAKAFANTPLTELRLDNNKITSEGIKILSKNKTITDINLNSNEIDDSCIKDLLSMESLVVVRATENKIAESAVKIIEEAMSGQSSVEVITLTNNPISKTYFSGFGKKRKVEEVYTNGESEEPKPKKLTDI